MYIIRLSLPVLFIVASLIYAIMIFQLQPAMLGEPNAPRYFPLIICTGILIFSIVDLINMRKENIRQNEDLEMLSRKSTLKVVGIVLGFCLVYTLIFEHLGFLISTILFLGALLFYLNGLKHWILNLSVTIITAFTTWYTFSFLLEISLP
ncbi:tripartite tricarboxylate transporter TctB family protein [Geomicrobium sediminis]|uniref:Tricarboxylic transport membrane protein n=1 Tax=Geomicrobium sediminis TaxID=1347788 RepID=A0ABS2PFD2_9BACL|nr:tripartite tricarboxylate transporter TctB family protein [Geomicrobium sediminis]MBM7634145.1 putative tricarboxylic transport membrane protein [Geomicrobium sediminis]